MQPQHPLEVSDAPTSLEAWRLCHEQRFLPFAVPITVPGRTISPNSQLKQHHLGKVPGVCNSDGSQSGLRGWEEKTTTVADAKKYGLWGAGIGLQASRFPGLDIDVENEAWAAKVQGLAEEMLGLAPVRRRQGSPRRLLVYRRAEGHEPIRKRRLAWVDASRTKHAVELLGHGQQYVIEGQHPKGGRYEWQEGNSLFDAGPDNLAEISADMIEAFFAELAS